jgi:hypothetical protein
VSASCTPQQAAHAAGVDLERAQRPERGVHAVGERQRALAALHGVERRLSLLLAPGRRLGVDVRAVDVHGHAEQRAVAADGGLQRGGVGQLAVTVGQPQLDLGADAARLARLDAVALAGRAAVLVGLARRPVGGRSHDRALADDEGRQEAEPELPDQLVLGRLALAQAARVADADGREEEVDLVAGHARAVVADGQRAGRRVAEHVDPAAVESGVLDPAACDRVVRVLDELAHGDGGGRVQVPAEHRHQPGEIDLRCLEVRGHEGLLPRFAVSESARRAGRQSPGSAGSRGPVRPRRQA